MKKNGPAKDVANAGLPEREDRNGKNPCPVIVVGAGASAGGLKSLKKLFAHMPLGQGVAFVLIQHLEPGHENLTLNLLRNETALEVVEATEGMPVQPDRIHLLPPDRFLNIHNGRLTLQEPVVCNGVRMPIDHFFCSLAADQGRRACGILLSGAGSDGTLGLSEIKSAGGRTLVEDPGSAEFPGMPQSAIAAGVVDAVLPAEALAEAVVKLAGRIIAETSNLPAESPEFDADLRAVLEILRAKVGHDFRCYKPNTLVRRIRRRMTLAKIKSFAEYARFLSEHPEEVALLKKDLLIGVTDFFRQPQAWEVLREKVIEPVCENARPESEIRVWIPGCSTGKEAYSLAMLLAEKSEEAGKELNIQIFATDSDPGALAVARSGVYPEEEVENVSPARRKRFFERKDGRYQINKKIRDLVVFAPQNLTSDPPFSRLDLIICRNLLIYLDQQVQKKIIALFHFALREGGFLFLGNAETIQDREDLFEPVSKKWRIYRRIGVGRRVGIEIPVRPSGESLPPAGKLPPPATPPRLSLASIAQQTLLNRFVPPCVMIDRRLQVLYVHGPVEDYLTFPPGELTTRVVDMAREGLRARLRGAIAKCLEITRPVSVTARVRRGEKSVPVKATVSPLHYPRETDGLLLITFEDYRAAAAKSRRRKTAKSDIHQLEDELKVTREELQSTIDQLEISNDQLKASNEEVTAANEELQSANEEMETSKEELQSLNEELNTINTRLQEKVDETEGINNDLLNLLASTNIATVFLDKELRVRRFTPASTNLFSLIPSDVGRPVADVLRRFQDDSLLEDARQVLANLTPLAKDVQAEDGRWYIRRVTPYRTHDDRIEGVVVTFVDVCDLKQTEEALRRQQEEVERARTEAEKEKSRLEAVMGALPVGLAITDERGGNIDSNAAFEQIWGGPRPPARSVDDYTAYQAWWLETGQPVAPEEWASARALREGEPVVGQLMEIQRFDGSRAFVINGASPVRDSRGQVIGSAVAMQDITELRKAQEDLREAHQRAAWLARFPEENPNPVARVSAEGKILYRNPAAGELPAWPCEVGQSLPESLLALVRQVMNEVREIDQDVELGGRIYSVSVVPFPGELYANVYGRDITQRRQAEDAVRKSEARFRLLSETAGRLLEADNPQGIVNELCRDVMSHLDCQAFFNFLVDETAGRLHLNACSGIPEEEAKRIEWLDFGVAVCGCAARDGCRIVAEHIPTTPDVRTELVKSFGIKAYACHPLLGPGGKVMGTLSFGTRTRETFSEDDLSLMKAVTDQVAAAVERMRLFGELQKSRDGLAIRVQERTAQLARADEMLQAGTAERLRLVAAVEQAGEGVVITGPSGLIEYVNPAMKKISGREKSGFLGKDYYDFLAGEGEDPGHREKIHQTLQARESWSGHVNRKTEGGQPYQVDVTFSPIRDSSGKVTNYLGVERDVTQEVRLEEHLRHMQKMEALGTLAGGIAHDFNNLLNPIFINTEMILLETPPGSPSRLLLQTVLQAAERGRNLVKQIITFSRQKEQERKPMKAQPVVQECLKFLRASLPRTVEIREDLQPETGYILADPTQIHQVVMNLCSNAAYAMREQGGVLEVSLAEVDLDADSGLADPDFHPGSYLRLTVSDTGAGMTREIAQRAFDPFFTTKRPGEGSGMGLSVVHGIVKSCGGAITFQSDPGRGSTFNIFFPRVEEKNPALDISSEAIPRGRGERVLLVEDEEAQAISVKNMLERLGYTVAVRNDGREALDLFRSDPQSFHLVVTDQTMPLMTGVKLAEELFRIRPDLPIILCTGYSETVDADRAEALGIRQFLMKPFSMGEMAQTVRRALDEK